MYLNQAGRKIYFNIKGKGNPIILVHGWGGSSKSLLPLAELLARKFKVVSLDLPGFGNSDKPNSDWGVEEYAQFIIDFICELKLRPVYYFGHSFGGALGIYLAANKPQYIKKLIISGGSFKRELLKVNPVGMFFRWLPTSLKLIIYRIAYPNSDIYKIRALESNFRKIVRQDLTPLLSLINIPSLILWGEEDNQTPVKLALELKRKLKQSKLKIFPGIGHNLPLKYPQLVFSEIEKFL